MIPTPPQNLARSPRLNRHFSPLPGLFDLPLPQAKLVRAFRLTVLHGKANQCPLEATAPLLGGVAAAAQFVRVVQVFGAHWPEAIRIYRPCCPRVSPDEQLLLDLVHAILMADAPRFRAALSDMLPEAAISVVEAEIAAFTAAHIVIRPA